MDWRKSRKMLGLSVSHPKFEMGASQIHVRSIIAWNVRNYTPSPEPFRIYLKWFARFFTKEEHWLGVKIWDMTYCSLVHGHQRFGKKSCLHLQYRRLRRTGKPDIGTWGYELEMRRELGGNVAVKRAKSICDENRWEKIVRRKKVRTISEEAVQR
jgi:hypothetical protein